MSAKSFYQSSAVPQLWHRLQVSNRIVEVWTTTCIVTNFGTTSPAQCSMLINPCNPQLSGVKNFPYFPRGGPVPNEKPMSMHKDWQPLGYVSQWGGMEVGDGMLFPVSVVDGLVHQFGGWKLEAECAWKRTMATRFGQDACPVGEAVKTSAGNDKLAKEYNCIIHTTPPFYKYHDDAETCLRRCYDSSLTLAFQHNPAGRVASPLLGAGARGFPEHLAVRIAAESVKTWLAKDESENDVENPKVLAFGLLEKKLAEHFLEHFATNPLKASKVQINKLS